MHTTLLPACAAFCVMVSVRVEFSDFPISIIYLRTAVASDVPHPGPELHSSSELKQFRK